MAFPRGGSSSTVSRSNWNLEVFFFLGEGKTGVPGEKPLGAEQRTNNKLNPHMTPSPGIEPGTHWWKASVLTTALDTLVEGERSHHCIGHIGVRRALSPLQWTHWWKASVLTTALDTLVEGERSHHCIGHIGGRRALSPLRQPCSPNMTCWDASCTVGLPKNKGRPR